MKSAFLMVIITMMSNNQMSGAFVNTPTQEACEKRSGAVKKILTKGNVDIRLIKCFPGTQKFEKFQHRPPEGARKHNYLVKISGNNAEINKVNKGETCNPATAESNSSVQQYCVSSTQGLVESNK